MFLVDRLQYRSYLGPLRFVTNQLLKRLRSFPEKESNLVLKCMCCKIISACPWLSTETIKRGLLEQILESLLLPPRCCEFVVSLV